MHHIIRLIICILLFLSGFYLIYIDMWGYSTISFFLFLLGLITYFKNEKLIIALYFMQKQKLQKSQKWLFKIAPNKELIKSQRGYYYLMRGLSETPNSVFVAEKLYKQALKEGLKDRKNLALAKLGLCGGAMARRNKKHAQLLLKEVTVLDKSNLFAEQTRMMKQQLKRI